MLLAQPSGGHNSRVRRHGQPRILSVILLILIFINCSNAVNFTQCLADVQLLANETQDTSSLRFNNGSQVTVQSIFNATALTIDACYSQCGTGQEPFDWETFSQDFAAWLLPYLALISQLPFGARYQVDNLMAAVLTVGSPTLAGYSLFLTLLNTRWINGRFSRIHYPTTRVRETVVRVLSSLQQVPLRIRPGEAAVFESLVILPENDKWWSMFDDSLNYIHTWSISSATSIAWVIVAYLLTVADSLSNVADSINSNGQGTGSVWLWLLPIVVGWLVLSPKCAYGRIKHAYKRANEYIVVVAQAKRNPTRPNPGLVVEPEDEDLSSPDEARTPPVFNYSRALSWSRSVYVASLFYDAAWSRAQDNRTVDNSDWNGGNSPDVPDEHRQGDRAQIIDYCQPKSNINVDEIHWAPGVFKRMILASLVTLILQWGTTCAAVLAVWFTPTTKLGCRSLAYLIYGALSTVAWFLLVSSSVLAHYARRSFTTTTLLVPAARTGGSSREHSQISLSHASPPHGSAHASGGPSDAPHPVTDSHTGGAQQYLQAEMSNSPRRNAFADVGRYLTPTSSRQDVSENLDESDSQIELRPLFSQASDGAAGASYDPAKVQKQGAMTISHYLRWAGKTLASLNAVLVITISVFQYANVFDRCFCNSSVFSWGSQAYDVIVFLSADVALVKGAWIGGFVLAFVCSALFVGLIYLLVDSLPA
ncbi:hypothetical protein PAXRUDRAFT_163260 [Paxillus rubicundulus Ve08.2h10]|uniref:Uncharacterized protein n=1 Tax=Paxillus rubicundulus Ve08.2h10 TaxID=930991 RepID=A0A0D0CTG1_9AGAM|nr:hypothetical protein PAXRUDRAFT_163260 [Paxillus rubicundulus Ve08.2h10]